MNSPSGHPPSAHPYDRIAAGYSSPRNENFYQSIAQHLEAPWAASIEGKTLDLGCGVGFSTEVLERIAPRAEWHAVDASAELLNRASERLSGSSIHLLQAEAESLPFSASQFEWVTSSLSFHWFRPSAENELYRIIKPGGRLSLAVPLLSPGVSDSGNTLLRSWVLSNRRTLTRRPSQGLKWAQLRSLFSRWQFDSATDFQIAECFSDSEDLADTLRTRGAWDAIFGANLPARPAPGPLSFTWTIGILHLTRPPHRYS